MTGIEPTYIHRAGDSSRLPSKTFPCDAWDLQSPLPEDEPLDAHLKWLIERLKPHYSFFKSQKSQEVNLSIFWGYITEVEQNDFSLSPEALEIFSDLGISLDFSTLAS